MPSLSRLSKANTTVKSVVKEYSLPSVVVTLYHTDIVSFNDKTITLNNGGWETSTTKNRMNQASNQFLLGFRVVQRKGEWLVEHKGHVYNFVNGVSSFER